MGSLLLPLHLVFAGIWLGCVLTEALFERALLGKGREQELLLCKLHKRVDLLVEIPAFIGVVATGLLLLPAAPSAIWLAVKIGFGALAVLANLVCVWLVFRRARHAAAGNWSEFERMDHLQHKIGALVLVGIVAALGLGLYF